jgi:opacity protein-like surface antigen
LLTCELMRTFTSLLIAGFVLVCAVSSAEAQRVQTALPVSQNAPSAGTFALAASISPTKTESAFLDDGLGFSGYVEGYLARWLSLRGQVGAAFWDIDGLSFDGTVRPVFALANVSVGWTAGDWRPYVTGGGGVYRYNYTEAGVDGENTKNGWNAGAGAEYFFAPSATLTFETQFHKVVQVPTNRATLGYKGSFWAFTVGAKKYF